MRVREVDEGKKRRGVEGIRFKENGNEVERVDGRKRKT
jgi:hypothetical protein